MTNHYLTAKLFTNLRVCLLSFRSTPTPLPFHLLSLISEVLADHTITDNPATFAGMPAHIQIMGKPMQDEELMEILKVVDGMLAKE
jgi:hypothetical protein